MREKRLEIEAFVTFHGFLPYDQVPGLFKEADIFVMPCVVASSRDRDGIPTVLMEALLHHLPVISTPVSGVPELIEDGVTGVLVQEKNEQAECCYRR